jgi:hypothetical protein
MFNQSRLMYFLSAILGGLISSACTRISKLSDNLIDGKRYCMGHAHLPFRWEVVNLHIDYIIGYIHGYMQAHPDSVVVTLGLKHVIGAYVVPVAQLAM